MLTNIKSNFIRNLLVSILTFISSIVYARVLGPDLYGQYTYITWLVTTVAVVIAFGIPGTITKFMPDYYYNNNYQESYKFYKVTNSVSISWGLFVIIVMGLTSPYWVKFTSLTTYNGNNLLLWAASIAILPTLLNSIGTSYIQSIRAFNYYAKVNVFSQFLLIGVSIIIVYTTKSILWMTITIIIANFIQYFAYHYYMKKNILTNYIKTKKIELKDKTRIIKYSSSMYINIIWQQVVWTRSEFFFLGLYSGSKDIAIYSLAFSLNSIINTVFAPIMNVLVNNFSELVSKKEEKMLNFLIFYATKYFNLFLVPIFFIALFFYEPILKFVYSDTYAGVTVIFPMLFFGTLLSVIMSVGNSIPFYYEKQGFIILMGIVVGVLNITLDILLIPEYGYVGAAVANTVSQIVFTLIAFIYNIKSFKVNYPIRFFLISIVIGIILFLPGLIFVENVVFRILYCIIAVIIYFYLLKVLKLFDEVDKGNYKKVINMIRNLRR